jgi:hypothetical protein
MNKKINEIIYFKGMNISIGTFIFLIMSLLSLMISFGFKGFFGINLFFSFFLIILFRLFFLSYRVIFYENRIELVRMWNNKLMSKILYSDIKKVNSTYFSDTSYRAKQFVVSLRNGSKTKIVIVHVVLKTIAEILIKNNVPIFVEKNGKYINYLDL